MIIDEEVKVAAYEKSDQKSDEVTKQKSCKAKRSAKKTKDSSDEKVSKKNTLLAKKKKTKSIDVEVGDDSKVAEEKVNEDAQMTSSEAR
jgi:hypothetical protein